MHVNNVKAALLAGEVQVGTWIHTLGNVHVPRVLRTAGFDYVSIDMEHSSFSIETVGDLCLAALNAGLVPVVRPSGHDHHLLSRPADNGALGIYIPHVDTAKEAEDAVSAVRFPPLGQRGSQPPNVHTDFARTSAAEYMRTANEQTMVIVQIESRTAVENLDEILAVEGVDGASVGRGDLSNELGLAGQRDHPDVVGAVEKLIAVCESRGKIPALLVQQVDEATAWIKKGIRMVTYASEVTILRDAASQAVANIREFAGPRSGQ
jgi:4-hydroxy-2-oxoheptanedioate aldolase